MKRTSILVTVCAGVVSMAAGQVLGSYVSIQHNLFNQTGDTTYTVADGRFLIMDATDLIVLNDGGSPLPGTITNGQVELETFFDHVYVNGSGDNVGVFKNGSLTLTFNYDGVPHEISGPITAIELKPASITTTLSKLDGEGLWDAVTADLPGSGDWPDAGGFSSLTSLSLAFDYDLTDYEWDYDLIGRVETNYTLWPDDRAIPEPVSLVLMALGTLGLLRRRRA